MRIADYSLLSAFCALLFGYVAICGRPMTLHEARLPECSREMMAGHQWLIPMNGDRPWLERPPFPHWCMIAVAELLHQHCDNEWSVRIAPALAGLLIVLMTAAAAGRLFGRSIGVMSGLMLATMFEFYNYATYSEDDIFLALLVVACLALFVRQEFSADPNVQDPRLNFLAWRPWPVLAFFFVLGLTNLAKGPIVGAAVVIGPILAYFFMPLLQTETSKLIVLFHWPGEHRRRIRRYLWLWGFLIAIAIGLSWHVYIHLKYPGEGGYLANLHYDFYNTHEFDAPWWYYPPTLVWAGLPWTPLAIIALILTVRRAWRDGDPALRFLWCWAIMPIIVLSLPHRKHHHYLVPSLAPWAILAAVAAKPVAQHMFKGVAWSRAPRFGLLVYGLPGTIALAILAWKHLLAPTPDLHAQIVSAVLMAALLNGCVLIFYYGLWKQTARWLLFALVIGMAGLFSWKQTYLPDDTVPDTQFLRQDVEAAIPKNKLLAIDAAIGPLDFFRVQFYLRSDALLLHNLSYLRSSKIHDPDVYLVARVADLPALQSLGKVELLKKSPRPLKRNTPSLALFHLTFDSDLDRFPPPPVSPMQAMSRQAGPWCGPPLPELQMNPNLPATSE
jgi:4-amino-4-deoxy-L-arabinose transferase-like glycosyltransferase